MSVDQISTSDYFGITVLLTGAGLAARLAQHIPNWEMEKAPRQDLPAALAVNVLEDCVVNLTNYSKDLFQDQ